MVKPNIPFTKLPDKANFNYISPVIFDEDIPDHAPSLNFMSETDQESEE
jgi:hypothetical protein